MKENQNYIINFRTDTKHWSSGQLQKDGVEYKEEGIFLLNGAGWQISHEDLKFLGIQPLPDNFDITNKKLYRYPRLNLPRQKVDLLKEKYNVKVIRDVEKSDIQIVSLKFFNKLASSSWNKSFNKTNFYEICKELSKRDLLSDDVKKSIGDILQNTHPTSVFDIRASKDNWNSPQATKGQTLEEVVHAMKKELEGQYHKTYVIKKTEDIDTYNELIKGKMVVLDRDIAKICSAGLAIISKDDYPQLEKMITSGDIENRSIALESLANCNIEASFDVVALLYYYCFEWCKSTNNWNTVNVKTLRNRFSDMNTYGNESVANYHTQIIKYLYDEGYLTEFAIETIKKNVFDKVLTSAGLNKDYSAFEISLEDIKIKNPYKESIIESICL
jgi:hypothetical protein